MIESLVSGNCFCKIPTNYTSEIDKKVHYGCPEHSLNLDQFKNKMWWDKN